MPGAKPKEHLRDERMNPAGKVRDREWERDHYNQLNVPPWNGH